MEWTGIKMGKYQLMICGRNLLSHSNRVTGNKNYFITLEVMQIVGEREYGTFKQSHYPYNRQKFKLSFSVFSGTFSFGIISLLKIIQHK